MRVDDLSQAGRAWREALAVDRPSLIEGTTDPEVPALLPRIGFGQAAVLPKVMHGRPLRRETIGGANTRKVAEVVN